MDHLYKFLNRKDAKDIITKGICSLSLKIDGNAFQISTDPDSGQVKYYKRSGSPEKVSPSKEITMYDCCFNEFYGDAILFFRKKEDILQNYDIINCEIMDKQHIIEYDDTEDNKIFILSALQDGEFIDRDECEELADSLGVSRCPVIIDNERLPQEIIDVIESHWDAAQEFEGSVKQLADNDLYNEVTELLEDNDIDWDSQEGLVFAWTYKGKNYSAKLNNPMFIDKWFDIKEVEENETRTDFTEVSRVLADIMEDHLEEVETMRGDEYLENMLLMFSTFTQEEIKDLYDSYNVDTEVNPAESKFVIMTCPELKDKLKNNIYRSVLNVMFIIMYKPKKRKTDLTDWDTQERINKIIEYLH